MPESDELALEVAILRREVEDIGSMTESLVRVQPGIRDEALAAMRKDTTLARVFSLIDGSASQGDIQKALAAAGLRGASKAAISGKFDKLENELHLIRLVRRTKSGNVYARTRLGHALHLDRTLMKEGIVP
jgi:hypothetical protein